MTHSFHLAVLSPRRPAGAGLLYHPLCCLALVLTSAAGSAWADPPQVYKAARIWTGQDQPISNGVLVVRDGKIVAVGPRDRVAVPAGAEMHDLGKAVLIPGLVIAETTLGEHGRDDERALTPEFRAIDGFDFYGDYDKALAGGVTTVQIAPGSQRLMPGQGAVVKLAGPDPGRRTLRERESLRILFGDAFKNPPRIFEPPVRAVSTERPLETTRRQLSATLGGAVAGLRALFRAAGDYAHSPSARSEKDITLAAVADYLQPNRRVRITATGPTDLRAALALAHEFHFQIVLVDPASLEVFRERLPAWGEAVAGVILSGELKPGVLADTPIPDKDEPRPLQPWDIARALAAAGTRVAIRPGSDSDLEDTLFAAGMFRAGRLSAGQVLRMLTVNPAEILGVQDRVGSLAAGKDADFVVLDADPFAVHTRVQSVFVDGKQVFTAKTESRATVIRAGRLFTGTGDVLSPGALVVEGSKIAGLGRDVSAPADALVRRYDQAVVVPGFLDMETGLGLGGPLSSPVALNVRLGARLVAGDPACAVAREGGVTTVLLASTNSAPGPVVAFKLGDKPRVVQDPVAIRFAVTGNLTTQAASLRGTLQAGRAYAQSWARFDAAWAEYEKKKEAYKAAKAAPAPKPAEAPKTGDKKSAKPAAESKTVAVPNPPDKPRVVEALEPYRALFGLKIPALVEARRADAIKLAVQIFRDEFKVRTILMGADDAFRLAPLLKEKQVAVAAGPEMVRTVDKEPVNLPQVLANGAVPFGFHSKATTGVKSLPLAVRFAVHRGLGADDALAALTSSAAKLLSLEDRVGQLAPGRDADLVVLSGPPLNAGTRVLAVMIDGQWVYEEDAP